MAARIHVLLVDDDPIVLQSLERVLALDFDVTVAPDPHTAIALCREGACDALVTDFEMPTLTGEQLIPLVREVAGGPLAVVVLTGTMIADVSGADAVMHKPADVGVLAETIRERVAQARADAAEVVA